MQLGMVDYDALTAPFLYKLGDTLSSYIETNTDVMNNLKPFEYEASSDEEDDQSEQAEEEDPREEEKEAPEQIDTSAPRVEEVVPDKPEGDEPEKPAEDLE